MSPDHLADNEPEELYVEDLDLGDISGAGLSGMFAKAESDDEVPSTVDDEELPDLDLGEADVTEDKPKTSGGRRGGLFSGLGKIKETFAEELEKARAEEAAKDEAQRRPTKAGSPSGPVEALSVEEEPPPPLVVPELEDEEQAPLPLLVTEESGPPPAPLEVPAFDEDEELVYEEPEDLSPLVPPSPPSVAPQVEEEEAPLLFGAEEGDEVRSEGGFLGMLRQRWEMAKSSERESSKKTGPEGAGVDISPPGDLSIGSLIRRMKGNGADPVLAPASAVAGDESGFAALLKPLSGSEVAMLQADLASDETVFAQIDRRRRDMADRQLLGFLIGIACLVFFAVSSGHDYLVNVLPNAAQPSWIPDSIRGDDAGAGLYALGLLFPLISLFVIADGVRYLLSAAVLRRVDDLLMGMVAAVCSMGALYSCSEGQVISGGMFLVAYGIVYYAARLLGVKKG